MSENWCYAILASHAHNAGGPDQYRQSIWDSGYSEGAEDGYRKGAADGYRHGAEDGFRKGKEVGLEEGYSEGQSSMHPVVVLAFGIGVGICAFIYKGIPVIKEKTAKLRAKKNRMPTNLNESNESHDSLPPDQSETYNQPDDE